MFSKLRQLIKRLNIVSNEHSPQLVIALVLIASSVSLALAVLQLQSLFDVENQRSIVVLQERKRGIENYAQQKLRELADTEINAAVALLPDLIENPLLDDQHYYWRQNDSLRIPIINGTSKNHSGLIPTYEHLLKSQTQKNLPPELQTTSTLLNALKQAITQQSDAAVEHDFRQLLALDLSDELTPPQTVAARLAQLEVFSSYARASDVLIEKLLRDDLQDSQGRRLISLQKLAIQVRPMLNSTENVWLLDKVKQLSERSHVQADDFATRMSAQPELPPMINFESADTVITNNGWLLTNEQGSVFGTRIDKHLLTEWIESDMLKLGLLSKNDQLSMYLPSEENTTTAWAALRDIRFEWQSQDWHAALQDNQHFYGLKTTILFTVAAILFSIVFLVAWLYRKQARWIHSKSEFVATVSHELRTPLSSIRLMAERLADRLQGDEKAKDYPQRIIKDIDTLSFLTDNILSFERINSGKWVSHLSPVGLPEIVNDLQAELPLFVKKEFQINSSGFADVYIYADPILMKLLFLNLAKNSCSYNDNDQVIINVRWQQSSGKISVWFQDNGTGIAAAEVQECFEPFTRGRNQKHSRGSGLGLALCRKIAHLHHGEISVESTGQDGTCFKIEFKSGGIQK